MKQLLDFVIKLVTSVVILCISLFWTSFVVFYMVVTGVRRGFGSVFAWKDRTKFPPPIHYTKWDAESRHNPGADTKQWNHAYITVPKTSLRFHYVYSGSVPSHVSISAVDGETTISAKVEDSDIDQKPKLMLCAHGFPENWFSWRHILRAYDDQPEEDDQYFVIAVDLRGYGDSDIPRGKMAYHVKYLAGDIKGIVNALGYDKCAYVGHDWGALIGWVVARIYPEIMEKCILMNCPQIDVFGAMVRTRMKQFLKSWYIFFFQIPFLPELNMKLGDYHSVGSAVNGKHGGMRCLENRLTKEEVEVFKYSLRRSVTGPINYYRATISPFCQPGPQLLYPRKNIDGRPEHTVPILLIWGDQDAFLSKESAELSKKYMNPSNGSKVVFVEGSSHWIQQDQPEKAITLMREFLK